MLHRRRLVKRVTKKEKKVKNFEEGVERGVKMV